MPNGFPGEFVRAFLSTARITIAAPDALAELDSKGLEQRLPSTQRCFVSKDNKYIWNERVGAWRPRDDFMDPPVRPSTPAFLELVAARCRELGSPLTITGLRALEKGVVCTHIYNKDHEGALGIIRVVYRLEAGLLYFCARQRLHAVPLDGYQADPGTQPWYSKIDLKKKDPIVNLTKKMSVAVLTFVNPKLLKRVLLMKKASKFAILVFDSDNEAKNVLGILAFLTNNEVNLAQLRKTYRRTHKGEALASDEEENAAANVDNFNIGGDE